MDRLQPIETVLEPASKSTPTMEVTAQRVFMDPEKMIMMLAKEMDAVERLEGSITTIEGLLINSKNLEKRNDEELLEIYKAFVSRKHSAQQFVMRVMELGVKTDFMTRMLNANKPKTDLPKGEKPSKELARVRSILQQAIDRKVSEEVTN